MRAVRASWAWPTMSVSSQPPGTVMISSARRTVSPAAMAGPILPDKPLVDRREDHVEHRRAEEAGDERHQRDDQREAEQRDQ